MRAHMRSACVGALVVFGIQACSRQSARGAAADSVSHPGSADSMPNGQPCRPVRTGAELTQLVATQLPLRMSSVVTPVFPLRWPEQGSGVAAFAYRIDVPPTGRRTRSVTGPTHRLTFDTLGAAPSLERMSDTPLVGTEQSGDSPAADFAERMRHAVDVMVEVIAGCRTPEAARADLEPYSLWLSGNQLIAGDLRRHVPAFIDWLAKTR
jgi:hypothetical protein